MIELSLEIKTFLMAMTPIGELRLSIPVALVGYEFDIVKAYLISVAGNLSAVLIVLFLLHFVSDKLSQRYRFFKNFFEKLFSKTRDKYSEKINRYGHYLLILFVAIPLPITGGWTGSLVSFVFGIPIKKAFYFIGIGVMIAGVVVTLATTTGVAINEYLGFQALAGFIMLIALLTVFYKRFLNNNKKLKKQE